MTSKDFEFAMRIAARKHDLVALRITDKRELEMPAIGLVKMRDPETDQKYGWTLQVVISEMHIIIISVRQPPD